MGNSILKAAVLAADMTMRNLGISEKTPVFTYDGNMEGKEVFNNGGLKAVRVGDSIDLNSIRKVIGILNGVKNTITPEYITVRTLMPGMTAAMCNNIPLVVVLQIDGYSAGTYVIHSDDQNYVEYVELASTITPIDPKYLPEGGVGYTEPGKVYTFNGDVTGKKVYTTNGIQYVKIADEYTDPKLITKIVVSLNGNMVEFGKDDIRIGWNDIITREAYSVFVPFEEAEAQIVYGYNFESEKELWFIADPNYNAFVARLEYAETIHPISDKYLPEGLGGGGGLTVIELETTVADYTTTTLSEADIAKLSIAMGTKMPVAIRFNFDDSEVCFVCSYANLGGPEAFIASFQNREFLFINMMGSWGVTVQGLTG